MRHHHVAIGADSFIEGGALAEIERLGHVDLHMVDEVAVPDRLEQAIAEAEGEDVLCRFLAEKMVDAEDLLFGEDLMQLGIQRHGAGEVGAEGLLHDDAALRDEARFGEESHRWQGGGGRHAQIMDAPGVAAELMPRPCRPLP